MDPPPIVYGKFTDPIVYGKVTDPVEVGKFEPRNYSIGNYVYYLTNHNDLVNYINTTATVSDNCYNHF